MGNPIVFDRFNPPGDPGIDCSDDPGYTQQEFKEEVDINRIMKKALLGAEFPADVKVGSYGDFYDAPTFQQAMEIQSQAREQFEALPAQVRERFANDPAKFLAWVHDPKTTLEEANELGLLKEEASARLAAEEAARAAQAVKDAQELGAYRSQAKPGGVVTETLKTS